MIFYYIRPIYCHPVSIQIVFISLLWWLVFTQIFLGRIDIILLNTQAEVGLQNYIVILLYIFRTLNATFIVLPLKHLSTKSAKNDSCLISLSRFVTITQPSQWGWIISHCDLIFLFFQLFKLQKQWNFSVSIMNAGYKQPSVNGHILHNLYFMSFILEYTSDGR